MEYLHPKGLNILASIAAALANAIEQKTSSNTTNTTEKLQGKWKIVNSYINKVYKNTDLINFLTILPTKVWWWKSIKYESVQSRWLNNP